MSRELLQQALEALIEADPIGCHSTILALRAELAKPVKWDKYQVNQFLMGLTGPNDAQQVCIETYQVVGALLEAVGMFQTDKATKILDNLSEMKKVHDDVLPFEVQPSPQLTDDEIEVEWIKAALSPDKGEHYKPVQGFARAIERRVRGEAA